MSTNKTQNYQLHAWAPEDEHLRTELNANFAKLDTALKAEETARQSAVTAEKAERVKATPRVMAGTYMGSVKYNDITTIQTFQLGFRPKVVHIMAQEGNGDSTILILEGHPAIYGNDWIGRITATGFEVRNVTYRYLNNNEKAYHYWAIG